MDTHTHDTMSLPAAAQALQKSWIQTWRLVLVGTLKGSKVGSRWRVERESLDQLVQEQGDQ